MKRRSLTALARAKVFLELGGKCARCDRKIARGEPYHIDHVKPLSMGGADEAENFQILHVDCHAGKTRKESKSRAKADRNMKKHAGTVRPRNRIRSRGFGQWKDNTKYLERL